MKQNLRMLLITVLLCLTCASTALAAQVHVRHDLTREEIMAKVAQYPHNGLNASAPQTQFEVPPNLVSPYAAGSLKASEYDDALNVLKMVRFLAGVPYENIRLDSQYNNLAQHGAVLCAVTGEFSHNPKIQPSDMDKSFFDLGYQSASRSNLAIGYNSVSKALIGLVQDGGSNNIRSAGHRAWTLSPGGDAYGVGYSNSVTHEYIWATDLRTTSDSYICWPNSGAFPIQYFSGSNINGTPAYPWSIVLGDPYKEPQKLTATVKLVRARDNKTWIFDANTPDLDNITDYGMHFAINNSTLGKSITFRPDLASLGTIKNDDSFEVTVTGIQYANGSAATIQYTIDFFDMTKPAGYINAESLALTNQLTGEAVKDNDWIMIGVGDTLQFTTDVLPANATNKKVVWESSMPSVVSVTQDGLITGLYDHYSDISVTVADNPNVDIWLRLLVVNYGTIRLDSLSLGDSVKYMDVGSELKLTPSFTPSNTLDKSVTWKSSNSSVISVDDGKLTAHAPGTVTITVTSKAYPGKTATCEVSAIYPVSSITLNKSSETLNRGGELALTATVLPANASDKTINWRSGNTNVATVENGVVRAVGAGSATIYAASLTNPSVKASFTIFVIAQVTSINSAPSITMGVMDTIKLDVEVLPSDAPNRNIKISSDNEDVVGIVHGQLRAYAVGTATITVESVSNPYVRATCTVTVYKRVSKVTLNKTSAQLLIGSELQLDATVQPADASDKSVTWISDHPEIATVHGGKVVAVSAGSANITATSASNPSATATCKVTVTAPVIVQVSSVTLNATRLSMSENGAATLTATVRPDNSSDKTLIWTSSAPSIVEVNGGALTARALGTATITATSRLTPTVSASCVVEVVRPSEVVESVEVSASKLTLRITAQKTLTATVLPAEAADAGVIWSSSNPAVATVSDGKITAIKKGTAIISATAPRDSTKFGECTVTVSGSPIAVRSLTLNKKTLSIEVGASYSLKPKLSPSSATRKDITWSSNATDVATVDDNGQLTPLMEGTATITAKAFNGKKGTCKLTVMSPVREVQLPQSSMYLKKGSSVPLAFSTITADGSVPKLQFSTSNKRYVTVSKTGIVKGIKKGSATITVKAQNGKSAKVKVYVQSTALETEKLEVLNQNALSALPTGASVKLELAIEPANAHGVLKFSSSDPSVASVDARGLVTAHRAGTARIVIELGLASCAVDVLVR